ncbi:MAG TPA: HAMP domain-containing protein, partial [Verrucomicrobiae bacterium]|nr:HAMP domain-containing protein [Verrucomicrobiae bacterium]
MTSLSSLRVRLAGTVLLAVAPAVAVMYWFHLPWMGFVVGLVALIAAWIGGERFVLRQVRLILSATERLRAGDMASRTGLKDEPGELGQLANKFDEFAGALQSRMQQQE